MQGVMLGFGVVIIIVAVGFAAARLMPGRATAMMDGLGPVIYYITNPALMVTLVAGTDLREVFGVFTPIALITAAICGGAYALVSAVVMRRPADRTAVGAMSSSYVNAGNIGLPIALYAVGSATPVVSVLLAQLLVVAPVYLAIFSWCQRRRDGQASGKVRVPLWKNLLGSVANPVTVGTAVGVVLALTGFRPPEIVWKPVEMLGSASVPMLLLMFGMSLLGQRPFRHAGTRSDIFLATGIKLLLMPVVAWAVGFFAFGLGGTALFGVVVMAALPTAQNVFLFSNKFGVSTHLARDVILVSSALSLPVILVAALLLG